MPKEETAVTTQTPPAETPPPAPETQEEETQEETTQETETPESEPGGLTEQEKAEGENLYRLLKDPRTAPSVIAALAAEHGLFPRAAEQPVTKQEERTAVKDIKAVIKDELGPEYHFISEKLSAAIEKIVAQERAMANQQFAELQRSNIERDVVASYEELTRETKGASKAFEGRMAQLSNEIPIGSQDVRTYIRRLYTIASGEKRSSPQKVADQIRRNASDAGARLQGGAAGTGGGTVAIPDKKMSLDESIQFALDQQQGGRKK